MKTGADESVRRQEQRHPISHVREYSRLFMEYKEPGSRSGRFPPVPQREKFNVAEPLLSVTDVSVKFGKRTALEGISFSLDSGGSAGHRRPERRRQNRPAETAGRRLSPGRRRNPVQRIRTRGCPIPIEAQKLGIELVYQKPLLVEWLNALQNIFFDREIYLLRLRWLPTFYLLDWNRMSRSARQLLARFDMPAGILSRQVSALSDEQRQVVALCHGLCRPVKLLLLDNSLAALSFQRQQILLEIIRELARQNVAIIISSDNLNHLFTVTDRILVLYRRPAHRRPPHRGHHSPRNRRTDRRHHPPGTGNADHLGPRKLSSGRTADRRTAPDAVHAAGKPGGEGFAEPAINRPAPGPVESIKPAQPGPPGGPSPPEHRTRGRSKSPLPGIARPGHPGFAQFQLPPGGGGGENRDRTRSKRSSPNSGTGSGGSSAICANYAATCGRPPSTPTAFRPPSVRLPWSGPNGTGSPCTCKSIRTWAGFRKASNYPFSESSRKA